MNLCISCVSKFVLFVWNFLQIDWRISYLLTDFRFFVYKIYEKIDLAIINFLNYLIHNLPKSLS